MFEARVKQSVLAEVLDVADALVEEAVLHFDDDGLVMQPVDKANVGMAAVSVPASDFETYETDGVQLGIVIDKVSDVLGMAGADELVEFYLDEETRKLEINADGLEYTMGLIDPSNIQGMDEKPDLPFGAIATVATSEVKRAIKAADMVSDHVTVKVEDGEASILASGDSDDIDYVPTDSKVDAGASGEVEDASSMFSLPYLKDMSKAIQSSYVRLGVADDMPLRIEFALDQSDGEGAFFLAPRISND